MKRLAVGILDQGVGAQLGAPLAPYRRSWRRTKDRAMTDRQIERR